MLQASAAVNCAALCRQNHSSSDLKKFKSRPHQQFESLAIKLSQVCLVFYWLLYTSSTPPPPAQGYYQKGGWGKEYTACFAHAYKAHFHQSSGTKFVIRLYACARHAMVLTPTPPIGGISMQEVVVCCYTSALQLAKG